MNLSRPELTALLARLLPESIVQPEDSPLEWCEFEREVTSAEYNYLTRVAVVAHMRESAVRVAYMKALYAIVDAGLPQHPELGGALEFLEPIEISYYLATATWEQQVTALAQTKGWIQ